MRHIPNPENQEPQGINGENMTNNHSGILNENQKTEVLNLSVFNPDTKTGKPDPSMPKSLEPKPMTTAATTKNYIKAPQVKSQMRFPRNTGAI